MRNIWGLLIRGVVSQQHKGEPNHRELMDRALQRYRLAELQVREAGTLEELDTGRAAMLAAQAEIQHIIRNAKRARGMTVRPITEVEELYRNMRSLMNRTSRDPSLNQSAGALGL